MPRAFTPKVVTANDLFDGAVVYFATGGRRPSTGAFSRGIPCHRALELSPWQGA